MSYVSQFYDLCTDVKIYAHLVNSGKEITIFYVFTGCDTVSSFFSKGKCRTWDVYHQSEQKDVFTTVFS